MLLKVSGEMTDAIGMDTGGIWMEPEGIWVRGKSAERRLGHRHEDVRFGVGWRLDQTDDRSPERRRQLPLPPQVGVLLNVSVTGASILAPSAPDLQVGSRLLISFRGVTGTVIVKRIGPSATAVQSLYAVEFAEPNSALTSLVYDTFVGEQALSEGSYRRAGPHGPGGVTPRGR